MKIKPLHTCCNSSFFESMMMRKLYVITILCISNFYIAQVNETKHDTVFVLLKQPFTISWELYSSQSNKFIFLDTKTKCNIDTYTQKDSTIHYMKITFIPEFYNYNEVVNDHKMATDSCKIKYTSKDSLIRCYRVAYFNYNTSIYTFYHLFIQNNSPNKANKKMSISKQQIAENKSYRLRVVQHLEEIAGLLMNNSVVFISDHILQEFDFPPISTRTYYQFQLVGY